jgi:hypothetical protein
MDKSKNSDHNQNNSIQRTEEDQGGYMRAPHTVEIKIYGPDSPLDNRSRVFLCVRHETVRWDNKAGEFTYSEISKKTGIDERRVREAVKILERLEMLQVMRRKVGGKSLPNIIGLHPKRFGDDFIDRSKKPTFSVINGGKRYEKLSTGGPQSALPGGPQSALPGGHNPPSEHHFKPLLEPVSGLLKNSSKELRKRTLKKGIEESFTLSLEKETTKAEDINKGFLGKENPMFEKTVDIDARRNKLIAQRAELIKEGIGT